MTAAAAPILRKPPYSVARARLSNGLRLLTIATPHLHSATICLYVRAGSRYERPETNGLSHFLEHMLFRGSGRYPSSFSLNLAIEQLGGTLYAETGRDYSLYQISLHPKQVARGLDILGDLFATPAFRDIDLERKIIVEEILEDLDDRGRNVNVDDQSRRLAWGDHPLGFSIIGPMRNVRRFSLADVRAHFRRFYGAANMVLAVAGPLDTRDVRRQASRGVHARPSRIAPHAAAAAPQRRRPALPHHPQRIGADAGARAVSRAARDRSRILRAARAGARARRRDVDAAALPDLRSEGAGVSRSRARCTRTTTARCWRWMRRARTRSCRRW